MRGLMAELNVCGGETEGFGDGVHAQFSTLVLVAVEEACDES